MRAILLILLAASVALAGCVGGGGTAEKDTDRDGIPDAQEAAGWEITITTANGTVTRHVQSSAIRPDSDGDGVSDLDEHSRGIDPVEVDTDGDGLLDGGSMSVHGILQEAFLNWSIVQDHDQRGRFIGEDDACGEDGPRTDPANWDSDRPEPDGVSDGDEVRGWNITVNGETRRVDSNPCLTDTDGDGMPDGDERAAGTDPRVRDTDGDGALDSLDVDPLRDMGVRGTVVSATLAEPLPEGAKLRVLMNVGGNEQGVEVAAPDDAAATFDVGLAISENTDDAMVPGSDRLPVSVFARFVLVGANGTEEVLDFSGDGRGVVEFTFDVKHGRVESGGSPPTTRPIDVAGADGGARFTFTREEF